MLIVKLGLVNVHLKFLIAGISFFNTFDKEIVDDVLTVCVTLQPELMSMIRKITIPNRQKFIEFFNKHHVFSLNSNNSSER